jgi:hypothetical protein
MTASNGAETQKSPLHPPQEIMLFMLFVSCSGKIGNIRKRKRGKNQKQVEKIENRQQTKKKGNKKAANRKKGKSKTNRNTRNGTQNRK